MYTLPQSAAIAPAAAPQGPPRVSIVIKALNEEAHIAAAIESALAALADLPGEVILADSCSTDRTVEIARAYPIRIVQLAHPDERCCGIGPQLGFQHAHGEFIYILDGDMQLMPAFLRTALAYLEQNPRLAGLAGQLEIVGGQGYEFQARKRQARQAFAAGPVDHLDCGGLYRREALQSVGYFSNRNLHAYEETELGLRLRGAGWELERLPLPAVRHFVHDDDSIGLMRRRWRSRYVDGAGELLRAAFGKPYFTQVVAAQATPLAVALAWIATVLALLALPFSWFPLAGAAALWAAAFLFLAVRKGGLKAAALSLANLSVYAAGLMRGLLRRQRDPRAPIASTVIADRSLER